MLPQNNSLSDPCRVPYSEHPKIGRILRYLASVGAIKETGEDTFMANNITKHLSDLGVQSAVYHKLVTHSRFVRQPWSSDANQSTDTAFRA